MGGGEGGKSSRLLRRGRHQGILDGGGEEVCLLKSCSRVHVSSEHSLFLFAVQINFSYIILVLHLLHSTFYNLHLLDWMGLEGRRGKVAR
jgi:hypothetical protein